MDAQIDTVIRELETLVSLPGMQWCSTHVNSALNAAKKARAIATNDYKTLWELECEETKRLAKYKALYDEERLESARLARQLLRYEGPPFDPRAHLVQAGGEPPVMTAQTRLSLLRWLSPDPSLVCAPAPDAATEVSVNADEDDLYD